MRVLANLQDFQSFVADNGGDLDAIINKAKAETAARQMPRMGTASRPKKTANGIKAGAKVEVKWSGDGEYYPATVVGAGSKENTWKIKWDEPGNPIAVYPARSIRPLKTGDDKPAEKKTPFPVRAKLELRALVSDYHSYRAKSGATAHHSANELLKEIGAQAKKYGLDVNKVLDGKI